MKNFLAKVAVLGLIISSFATPFAHASGEKFMVYTMAAYNSSNIVVIFDILDGTNTSADQLAFFSPTGTWTEDSLRNAAVNTVVSWANSNGYPSATSADVLITNKSTSLATVASTGSYTDLINLPTSPSSYQTIVSQTGTSAPAVSGGMTPMNSYSGTTFTWARTGAGVYTITASQAVFNTSGKTGVFISPLNNLNASVRGVVTSSTVITVTSAVQSVAVLGLLGLTTTPTDALLANTMIYVQTYP